MLTEEIEKLALSLPGTQENAHFGTRDFRVGKRIFMTLPEAGRAVFKLTPDQQRMLLETEPAVCAAVPRLDITLLRGCRRRAHPSVAGDGVEECRPKEPRAQKRRSLSGH